MGTHSDLAPGTCFRDTREESDPTTVLSSQSYVHLTTPSFVCTLLVALHASGVL